MFDQKEKNDINQESSSKLSLDVVTENLAIPEVQTHPESEPLDIPESEIDYSGAIPVFHPKKDHAK